VAGADASGLGLVAEVGTSSHPPPCPLLTRREQEVMALLATGRSRGQIARALDCSPRTVDKHVERIHAKLAVNNRVAAIEAWVNA
jgi:DNA-binding CsgD family transcriptional regulator